MPLKAWRCDVKAFASTELCPDSMCFTACNTKAATLQHLMLPPSTTISPLLLMQPQQQGPDSHHRPTEHYGRTECLSKVFVCLFWANTTPCTRSNRWCIQQFWAIFRESVDKLCVNSWAASLRDWTSCCDTQRLFIRGWWVYNQWLEAALQNGFVVLIAFVYWVMVNRDQIPVVHKAVRGTYSEDFPVRGSMYVVVLLLWSTK